ncbi:MAG: zinc ABC transporter substrate-binding protein [bacterium]
MHINRSGIFGVVVAAVTAVAAAAPEFRIVCSFYPVYLHTLNVARDLPGVDVTNLAGTQTGCLHDYALTMSARKTLHAASVLVINGAGMESYLDGLHRQQPDLSVVDASRGLDLIRDTQGVPNPHLWVSVAGAMAQVTNIAAGLAAADPAHADGYRRNAALYTLRLQALQARMQAGLAGVRTRKIVTLHEAFPYFAREFGLTVAGVIEREPGSEPAARELAETITLVRRLGLPSVFAEPQYAARSAEAVARATGAHVYRLDPAVTGPDDPDAYIAIMNRNLTVLREALGGAP